MLSHEVNKFTKKDYAQIMIKTAKVDSFRKLFFFFRPVGNIKVVLRIL